jgi:hypothetical protein
MVERLLGCGYRGFLGSDCGRAGFGNSTECLYNLAESIAVAVKEKQGSQVSWLERV